MKIKKKKPSTRDFEPYALLINVETKHEHEMLEELTLLSVSIPEKLGSSYFKACQSFLIAIEKAIHSQTKE